MNNPAKYRSRLTFEEHSKYQNDEGVWITNWITSDIGTVWSQIRTIRGKEFLQADAEQSEMTTRINMRYRTDIVKQYYALGKNLRLVLKQNEMPDRVFKLIYINNLEEKNIELEFIANEVS